MFSAMSDKSDCTELLVRSGAAVSSSDSNIVHSIMGVTVQVMTVDSNGQTALHWAALMVSIQIIM